MNAKKGFEVLTTSTRLKSLDALPPVDPSVSERRKAVIQEIEGEMRGDATRVIVKGKLVNIYPQDEKNMRTMLDRIYEEQISDLATIKSMVDEYDWSSEETKRHVRARFVDLFDMGALDLSKPRTEGITMELIDV